MTVRFNSTRLRYFPESVITALIAALLPWASLQAQEGEVLDPAPGQEIFQAQAGPQRLIPPSPEAAAGPPDSGAGQPENQQVDGVKIGSLGAIDPSAVGILDDQDGGLGLDMWASSERSLIERILPRLPVQTRSPVMQDLARRLLLTRAAVPEGPATVPSLLGLRVERLTAAGLLDKAGELLGLAGAGDEELAIATARLDALLLAGNLGSACSAADDLLRRDDHPRWLKIVAFCRQVNGDEAGAALALEMMGEQGQDDPAYVALFDLVSGFGGPKAIEGMDRLSLLSLAMLRAAGELPPAAAIGSADSTLFQAILELPGLDLDTRLGVAERAEMAGVISAAELAEIYGGVAFTPNQLANALSTASEYPGPRANALLYQVAARQKIAAVRAEILQTAWRLAEAGGKLATVARVHLDAVRSIEPSSELEWLAAAAARALLLAGDVERAESWLEVLRQGDDVAATDSMDEVTAGEPDEPVLLADLWPLFALAGAADSRVWPNNPLYAWWDSLATVPISERAAHANLVLTLLQAFGNEIPEIMWQQVMDGPLTELAPMPAPPLWRGLASAAAGGRVGETVLFALLVLDTPGPAGAHPVVLSSVILALKAVGLEADARRIALEALLGRES